MHDSHSEKPVEPAFVSMQTLTQASAQVAVFSVYTGGSFTGGGACSFQNEMKFEKSQHVFLVVTLSP